jgi:hypothetical protein
MGSLVSDLIPMCSDEENMDVWCGEICHAPTQRPCPDTSMPGSRLLSNNLAQGNNLVEEKLGLPLRMVDCRGTSTQDESVDMVLARLSARRLRPSRVLQGLIHWAPSRCETF